MADHARQGLRPHRHDRLRCRYLRQLWPVQLFHRQVRADRFCQLAGHRRREQEHSRQHHCADCRFAHGDRQRSVPGGTARQAESGRRCAIGGLAVQRAVPGQRRAVRSWRWFPCQVSLGTFPGPVPAQQHPEPGAGARQLGTHHPFRRAQRVSRQRRRKLQRVFCPHGVPGQRRQRLRRYGSGGQCGVLPGNRVRPERCRAVCAGGRRRQGPAGPYRAALRQRVRRRRFPRAADHGRAACHRSVPACGQVRRTTARRPEPAIRQGPAWRAVHRDVPSAAAQGQAQAHHAPESRHRQRQELGQHPRHRDHRRARHAAVLQRGHRLLPGRSGGGAGARRQ
ncbi:hypothetical protein D3C80_1148360 [compost metagenome]